ncbi:cytochrome P450 [Bisporella sp. PMI_857]|nr:cytochrome P450 [Bisporella sp. PMI_857]
MHVLNFLIKALSSTVILVISGYLWAYIRSPIKNIPGPFIAKFTNLWRLFNTYAGRPELTQQMLHERYGPAVRIGPNLVSLSDPKLLRTIYNTRGDFLKAHTQSHNLASFYNVNDTKIGNTIIKNVFSTQSNDFHSQKMRPISKFYKMANILQCEPLVSQTINAFCKRLDEEFISGRNAGKTCKMDEWLLFFAWDVIGQLTFSRPMGFMDAGTDYNGLLCTADKALDYFATVGQIPALDQWLAKNPIHPVGPPSFDYAAIFCAQQSINRQKGTDGHDPAQRDMLDDFLEIKKVNPEQMDDNGVVGALLINIMAGADTTGILLRAVTYFVLKNPAVHKKLQLELDAAKLGMPVSYAAASSLPYLDAVIKEASRMHPGVGLLLERVVPESGLLLSDGATIPPGTVVGMNPWVIHQNKTIFGQDAELFRPERWLRSVSKGEIEEDYQTRLAAMKNADLSFGAGRRVCLGKNISIIETYKCIATLFLTYDMSFVDPEKEWHVQNSWFVRQSGIDIKIQRRVPART